MALFRIKRGGYSKLPTNKTDGYAYFTPDTKGFYIDVVDNPEQPIIQGKKYDNRIKINERTVILELNLLSNNWINIESTSDYQYVKTIEKTTIDLSNNDYYMEFNLNLTEQTVENSFKIKTEVMKLNLSGYFDDEQNLIFKTNNNFPSMAIPLTIKFIPKEI